MKKRILVCFSTVLLLLITSTIMVSAAGLQPADWSKSGQGTTSISQSADNTIQFSYSLNSSDIWFGQWWTFSSTAASTETFNYSYQFACFHAWFLSHATVIAYAVGPGGTQSVTLFDGGGIVNSLTGASSLNLTAGYEYGFKIFGENSDSTTIANGTLQIFDDGPFTISFDSAGGTPIGDISQNYNTSVAAPADPSREGYAFAGWSSAIPAVMPRGGAALTAQWTVNQYTITFDSTGGTPVGAITQNFGSSITAPADPSRVGYTFAGWNSAIPAAMPLGGAALTAQWTVNQYTITFDSAGGTTTGAITQNYGTAVTAPSNPSREGYTFAGWSSAVPAVMPAGGAALTAQWTVNQYTITFDSAGGTPTGAITRNYGTAVTAPSDPSREGYTFAGWSSAVPAVMPAGGAALTAKWTINQYTVTFYNWDNTILSTQTILYGGTAVPPSVPARSGYVLSGWRETYSNISGNTTVFPVFIAEIVKTGEKANTLEIGAAVIMASGAAGILLYVKKRQNK